MCWAGCAYRALASIEQVTAPDLNEWVTREPNLRVLDVRRKGEWDKGHVPFAEFRPLDAMARGISSPESKDPIVVHCQGGYRSIIACSLLSAAGYRNLINLQGGYDAWARAGLATTAATV